MTYTDLTTEQLIELAKLRLVHEQTNIEPTEIILNKKRYYPESKGIYAVDFLVKSKRWADFILFVAFTKMYPDEFLYLQKLGIEF